MDWDDYVEIVEAWNELYPDCSPSEMSEAELIEKIIALPGFFSKKQPNKGKLSFIKDRWSFVYHKSREHPGYIPDPHDICP